MGAVVVSGGTGADPRTPPALPRTAAPFLGTAVLGDGALTAAVDSYGDLVDVRVPGPAGRPLIAVPAERQTAGTVPARTAAIPRLRFGQTALAPWRASSVRQAYLPGSNVLRTALAFGHRRVTLLYAAVGGRLACVVERGDEVQRPVAIRLTGSERLGSRLAGCGGRGARSLLRRALGGDRRWLARARPLDPGAPGWARRMYGRSLLVLRALSDRRSGAIAAGARDGWAYVWPRDAAAASIALAETGYRREARRTAALLSRLDLGAAARFDGSGAPVPGRPAQGDALGWVDAARRAAGMAPLPHARQHSHGGAPAGASPWRDLPDYQEKAPGDYLANAIASASDAVGPTLDADGPIPAHIRGVSSRRGGGGGWIRRLFAGPARHGRRIGLVRVAGEPGSGLDSAAAWGVRPFALPALYPSARATLHRLAATAGRFGLVPSQDWPQAEPWTAPTAWSAWSLAALATAEHGRRARADRRLALRLLGDLRRAATPAGLLPERVDARSGLPRSTTPLAWSHAFAILTLLELWGPRRARATSTSYRQVDVARTGTRASRSR